MKKKLQIIVVDNNPTFLDGITTFLNMQNDYEILAKFSSSVSFLENINEYDPDLILLDTGMPDLNGFEIAKRLNYYISDLKLVAITMYQDRVYYKQLMEAGFRGVVNKNSISKQLCPVIDKVIKGDLAFPDFPAL